MESTSFHKLRLLLFQRMLNVLKVLKGFQVIHQEHKALAQQEQNEQRERIWNIDENIPSMDFEKLLLADSQTEESSSPRAGPTAPVLPPRPPRLPEPDVDEPIIDLKDVIDVFGDPFVSFDEVRNNLQDDVLSIIKLLKN